MEQHRAPELPELQASRSSRWPVVIQADPLQHFRGDKPVWKLCALLITKVLAPLSLATLVFVLHHFWLR